jgi:hypothetical protein
VKSKCELQNLVNHRIFERTLRPLVFRRARLSERHCNNQAPLGVGSRRRATLPEPVGGGLCPDRRIRCERSGGRLPMTTRSV